MDAEALGVQAENAGGRLPKGEVVVDANVLCVPAASFGCPWPVYRQSPLLRAVDKGRYRLYDRPADSRSELLEHRHRACVLPDGKMDELGLQHTDEGIVSVPSEILPTRE